MGSLSVGATQNQPTLVSGTSPTTQSSLSVRPTVYSSPTYVASTAKALPSYNAHDILSRTSFVEGSSPTSPTNNDSVYQDPYAQWGGQDAYNSLLSGYNTQKENIFSTATDAARNAGTSIRSGILDFVDQLSSGQRAIDERAIRNELAKRQGVQGVLGMVGRGIQSGGVMLANRNAGDSSGAQAIANAYGQYGQRQMANVGNQYEMGNREIGLAQDDLNRQRSTFVDRKYGENKESVINNIVSEARNALASLDAQMAEASLPERIAIEQEKQKIKSQVTSELSQYDQLLREKVGSIQAMDTDARRAEAGKLMAAGTNLGADAFNYTTEAPMAIQGTGPMASALPLYTFNRRRT